MVYHTHYYSGSFRGVIKDIRNCAFSDRSFHVSDGFLVKVVLFDCSVNRVVPFHGPRSSSGTTIIIIDLSFLRHQLRRPETLRAMADYAPR